jgi:hypothetical protein
LIVILDIFAVQSGKRQKVDRMNHSGGIALVDTASFKRYQIRSLYVGFYHLPISYR